MADEEVTHVMKHLFGSDSGIVEIQKIDTHVAKLPGLQGLTIVEDAMRAHGVGVGLAA